MFIDTGHRRRLKILKVIFGSLATLLGLLQRSQQPEDTQEPPFLHMIWGHNTSCSISSQRPAPCLDPC